MDRQAYIVKLDSLSPLTADDRKAVASLPMTAEHVTRRNDIVVRKSEPHFVFTLLSGWAARYEVRRNGARRITGILLPGDFCGIHAVCHAEMDHAIFALTDCEVGQFPADEIDALARSSQAIFEAIWRAKLQEEAILRKWLVYASDARQAVGHLLCELYHRAKRVGLAKDGHLALPLTQEEIGDAMGLTAVHINRVLRQLHHDGLIEISKQFLWIKDGPSLRRAAEFDHTYIAPWERGAVPNAGSIASSYLN